MSATKPYAEMSKYAHNLLMRRPCGWKLTYERDGEIVEVPGCTDWTCESPFGSVSGRVVMGPDGPVFDRPEYREAPNVNVVAWGRDAQGVAKFAVLRQPRPHADDPLLPPGTPNDSVLFGQIVMGFLERVIGKDCIDRYERPEVGAGRETEEESGAKVVLNIERPPVPFQNPNPTFVATWSDVVFIEVDLACVEALKADRNEPIFSAEYVSVGELMRRIRAGRDEVGALYRSCTSNGAWLIFFACHPELLLPVTTPSP